MRRRRCFFFWGFFSPTAFPPSAALGPVLLRPRGRAHLATVETRYRNSVQKLGNTSAQVRRDAPFAETSAAPSARSLCFLLFFFFLSFSSVFLFAFPFCLLDSSASPFHFPYFFLLRGGGVVLVRNGLAEPTTRFLP